MNYNRAIYPLQLIFYSMAFAGIYLALKPSVKSNIVISTLLSFLWFWMGIVYHLVYFTPINNAAYVFGGLFILQGALFFSEGVLKKKLSFKFQKNIYGITGVALIFCALFVYPLLSYSFHHIFPNSPTFGLPCPTTIFTFGFLLMLEKKCPFNIILIPFVWSIIGFTAAFKFGIVEDTLLLLSGLITFFMMLIRNRKLSMIKTH